MSAEAKNLHRFSENTLPENSGFLFSDSAQAQCLCTATRKAARVVTELYDLVLAPTGINQRNTSYCAAQAGEITQSHLGKQLGVTQDQRNTLSAMARYKVRRNLWVSAVESYGSGLPFDDNDIVWSGGSAVAELR